MGLGIAMKKCGMRDSREKGAGMRDQDPPFQTLSLIGEAVTTDELPVGLETMEGCEHPEGAFMHP